MLNRAFLVLLIAIAAMSSTPSYAFFIPPFQVKVVDAKNGEPIEGAVLLATWPVYKVGLHGDVFVGYAAIKEGKSDKNGDIKLAMSLRRKAPIGTWIDPKRKPLFSIYARGYRNEQYNNVSSSFIPYEFPTSYTGDIPIENLPTKYWSDNSAKWNGRTVLLFKQTTNEISAYPTINNIVDSVLKYIGKECPSKVIPLSLKARFEAVSDFLGGSSEKKEWRRKNFEEDFQSCL